MTHSLVSSCEPTRIQNCQCRDDVPFRVHTIDSQPYPRNHGMISPTWVPVPPQSVRPRGPRVPGRCHVRRSEKRQNQGKSVFDRPTGGRGRFSFFRDGSLGLTSHPTGHPGGCVGEHPLRRNLGAATTACPKQTTRLTPHTKAGPANSPGILGFHQRGHRKMVRPANRRCSFDDPEECLSKGV